MWPLLIPTKYYDGRKIVSLCVWPSIYYCAFTRSWDWNASLGHLQRCLLSCLGANIMFCFTLIIVIVIIAPCFSTVHFLQENRYCWYLIIFCRGLPIMYAVYVLVVDTCYCQCWWQAVLVRCEAGAYYGQRRVRAVVLLQCWELLPTLETTDCCSDTPEQRVLSVQCPHEYHQQ